MADLPHQAPLESETVTLNSGELSCVHGDLREVESTLARVCQGLDSLLAAERSKASHGADSGLRFEEQVSEARSRVDRLAESLDRIKIVALNAGLEGARVGDLTGKVLVGISEEIRHLTRRSHDLLLEQTTALEQLEKERRRLSESSALEHQPIERCATLREELESASHAQSRALRRLSDALQAATGLDADAQARLHEVSAKARALAESLASFASPEQSRFVRASLAAQLLPLLELLARDETERP